MSSIKRGQKGAGVLLLQGILHKLNYDISDVDGVFGEETESALKSFQSDLDLGDDGILGKNSANALVSELWASDSDEDGEDWEESDEDWGDDESDESSDDDDWGDDDDYDSV